MGIVIGLMVCGIVLGYVFREKNLKFVHRLINYAIFLLLFLLGISVGSNDSIVNHMETIGFDALMITIGSVAGSVVCAWGVYRFFFHSIHK